MPSRSVHQLTSIIASVCSRLELTVLSGRLSHVVTSHIERGPPAAPPESDATLPAPHAALPLRVPSLVSEVVGDSSGGEPSAVVSSIRWIMPSSATRRR